MAHKPTEKPVTSQDTQTTPPTRNLRVRTALKAGADTPDQTSRRDYARQYYGSCPNNDT